MVMRMRPHALNPGLGKLNDKESARYACDGRHKGCDERHTKHTLVTSVTHGVTDVTPFCKNKNCSTTDSMILMITKDETKNGTLTKSF